MNITIEDFNGGSLPNNFQNIFVWDEVDEKWLPVDGFSIAWQSFTQGLHVLNDQTRYHRWCQMPTLNTEDYNYES